MNHILLQIIKDSSKLVPVNSQSLITNYWFWIAAAELALILLLVNKASKKKMENIPQQEIQNFELTKEDTFQNSKETEIDMDNLMDSIHKSRDLYKKLSSKCHPDRFTDKELNKKADIIFQEITRNQRNYKKLLQLKEVAQSQLNITI